MYSTSNNTNDPFGHFSQHKKPQIERRATNFAEAFKEQSSRPKPASFAEAMRESASSRGPANFAEAMKASDARRQVSGESQITISDSEEYEVQHQEDEKRREQERLLALQREEQDRARFKARQEEVKKEIEALREAILKLAKSVQNFGLEFEKAAFTAPANPGAYHVSFFEKLKDTLELVKKRLDDSSSWLHTMNQRSKRKTPYFWAQVQKSGSKYMFSSERYMQMSAG